MPHQETPESPKFLCLLFIWLQSYKVIGEWAHVSPYLKEAHFLPIRQRIDYKIALTAYKCINNTAPDYLRKCVSIKSQPAKQLRTDNDYFLLKTPSIPFYKRTERGFSFCGPRVWNRLPYNLRTCNNILKFKKQLKHHLFTETFGT